MATYFDAQITPTEIAAGDSAPFTIRLVVGEDYTAGVSRLIFDFPGFAGMSRPSRLHQENPGYIDVLVSNPGVTYVGRVFDMEILDFATKDRQSWRGLASRLYVLDLSDGVQAGDEIVLQWGARARGYCPGMTATVVVPNHQFKPTVSVRYFESHDEGLPDLGRSYKGYDRPQPKYAAELPFHVQPRQTETLQLIRQHDRALLIPVDRFFNASVEKAADGLVDGPAPVQQNELGVFEYAAPDVHLKSKALPLLDSPDMRKACGEYNIYWGDVHTHSAFSNDCIEREKQTQTPDRLMQYARDRAGLDFYTLTDHHQPWDEERNKIGKPFWERTIEAIQQYDKPGRICIFPGFEYRCARGDTVVMMNFHPAYEEIDIPTWTDIRKLWEGMRGKDYITIPHFHARGGLPDGEWWVCPEEGVETVLEIFSCHGRYDIGNPLEQEPAMIKSRRPDRTGKWLNDHASRYGLSANSDGHKGHVGSNGLTAVLAKELTHEAILEAYRARRVYGTTNARIKLVFTVNGALMGAELPMTNTAEIEMRVEGESQLKKVELLRDDEVVEIFAADGITFEQAHTLNLDGPARLAVRVTQLDNQMAWSSPVWVG